MFTHNGAAATMADRLTIDKFRDLRSGDVMIHHVLEEKDKPSTKAGCKEFASVAVVPPVYAYLLNDDCAVSFLVTYHGYSWNQLGDRDRRGLVEHMLRHVGREVDEKGVVKWLVKGHDFEGFDGELTDGRAWSEGLREAAESVARQLTMDDAAAKSSPEDEAMARDIVAEVVSEAAVAAAAGAERLVGDAFAEGSGVTGITVTAGGKSTRITKGAGGARHVETVDVPEDEDESAITDAELVDDETGEIVSGPGPAA
jgi:hypothetical protein